MRNERGILTMFPIDMTYTYKCDECGFEYRVVNPQNHFYDMENKAKYVLGWYVSNNTHYCRECAQKKGLDVYDITAP